MDRSFRSLRVLAVAVACTTRIVAVENSPVAPTRTNDPRGGQCPTCSGHRIKSVFQDRWFTFPKFEETATYLKSRLQESGLTDIEIDGASADGHTQAGFWTMPLAWDVKAARLEMTSPEKMVLCDYEKVPTCLGMWSGPTPAGGIDAELVDLRNTPWEQVKGKIVLTDKNPASLKYELVKYKAHRRRECVHGESGPFGWQAVDQCLGR